MAKNIIDIYSIKSTNCNVIFNCMNNMKINNIKNKFNKISEVEYKMHLFNDIYLYTNEKTRECESISYVNSQIQTDFLVVNGIVTKQSIYSVPVVNSYNDVFKRHITKYSHGINIIRDFYSNETMIFIRLVDSQISMNDILQLIK